MAVKGIVIDITAKTSGMVDSLKAADSALTKTQNTLKSVNQALKFDGNNMDLLTSKSALLGDAIAQTSGKLDVLKETAAQAMETLGQEGGTTTEQMAELQAEISRTEQTLAGLETEAANTNAAMESVAGNAPEDMAELGEASEDAAQELGEVESEGGNASAALEALGGVAASVGASMAAAFAAAVEGAKEVGKALVNATVETGDYVDEMHTLESVTGISAERLQEMDYALGGLIDVSLETVTGSITKLEKSMSKAVETDSKYYETLDALDEKLQAGKISQEEYDAAVEDALQKSMTGYDQLGISVQNMDGSLRDSEEVFWDVIDALGQMEEGTDRDLLAMELLGKSAKDLNPLIEQGSAGFHALAEEAHEVGYVMDDETMGAFQNFDDQMERLGKSADAAKRGLGSVLLPTLSGLAGTGTDLLNKFTVKVNESGGDIGKIGDAISELLPELFNGINEHMPEIFGLIGSVTETLGQILIDNLPMLLDSALQIVETLANGLLAPDNIAKISNAAFDIIFSLADYLLSNLDTILSAATTILINLVNGLSSNLPLLIPTAIDAILTFVDTLLSGDQLGQILEASLTLITSLATGLIEYLPKLIERLPEIISGIVGFLTGDGLTDIIMAGVTLLTALVTNLPEIIGALLEAAGELIGSLFDFFTGDGLTDIGDAFLEIFDHIGDLFGDLIEDALTWGGDMIEGFLDGITGAAGDLWDGIKDVGSGIVSYIGFSKPEKGPLSHADEWGPDFVDLFAQGIDEEMPTLQASLNLMANTISGGVAASVAPDYSGSLNAINESVAGIAAAGSAPQTIVVQIGDERIGSVVASANANNNYIAGGY